MTATTRPPLSDEQRSEMRRKIRENTTARQAMIARASKLERFAERQEQGSPQRHRSAGAAMILRGSAEQMLAQTIELERRLGEWT